MIRPDVLYIIGYEYADESYAITPDGVGMYWYDDREAAEDDLPEDYDEMYFDSEAEFEDFRYGPA